VKKLPDALGTTADYIMNGDSGEKIKNNLRDAELIRQFKEMDKLPDKEKTVLLDVISAYLWYFKAKQAYMI
jgi:hypothetical protein